MRKIITILFVFIPFLSFSQLVRFNKSYVPVETYTSDVYEIVSTDSMYFFYGVNQYSTFRNLMCFKTDVYGEIIATETIEDTSINRYCNFGKTIMKNHVNIFLIASTVDYSYNPSNISFTLYKFDGVDTILTKNIFTDTTFFTVFDNVLIDSFFYTFGEKQIAEEDHKAMLIKSDINGNLIWTKYYGGTRENQGRRIIETYDNNLMTASWYGYWNVWERVYDCQWRIEKLDTAGNSIWEKLYGNPERDDLMPADLIETSDSSYIITGAYAEVPAGNYEADRVGWFLKIKANNGAIIFEKKFGHASLITSLVLVKEKANKDFICVLNESSSHEYLHNSSFNPIVLCLSPTGDLKWLRRFHFDYRLESSEFNTFDFTNDGGYIFAGYGEESYDSVPIVRSWIVKTDSLGFDGTTCELCDTTFALSLANDTVCFADSVLLHFHISGISAPYSLSLANGNSSAEIYYSPMLEPYAFDSLYIYPTVSYTTQQVIATATNPYGEQITDTFYVFVDSCAISTNSEDVSLSNAPVNNITIFPNPSTGILNLRGFQNLRGFNHKQSTTLKIYNVVGSLVYQSKITNYKSEIQINLSHLPKGLYFIDIGGFAKEKFILE